MDLTGDALRAAQLIRDASAVTTFIAASLRIWTLRKPEVAITRVDVQRRRVLLWLVYFILRLASSTNERSSAWRLALHLSVALVVCALVSLEQSRAFRPSTTLILYLALSLVSDAIEAIARSGGAGNAAVALLCELALLAIEVRGRSDDLKSEYRCLNPESLSSILGNAVFSWVSSLLLERRGKRLAIQDVPALDSHCSSKQLRSRIELRWAARDPERGPTLLRITLRCIQRPLLWTVPSRLALLAFRYAQPLLMEMAIRFMNDHSTSSDLDRRSGRLLVFGTALVYVGMALSASVYVHSLDRMKVMVRGSLISLVHSKVLQGRGSNAKTRNERAIALVTTDVDSLSGVAEMIHETWAQLLEVILGLTLLTQRIGWIRAVLLLSIFGSRYVARNLGPKQKAWNGDTQRRLTTTAEMVNQAKQLRMSGMSGYIGKVLTDLRRAEIETSKKLRWVLVWYNASANALGIFSPVIVLVLYALLAARSGHSLDATTAFTSTALLTLVTHPANMVMTILPRAVAAQVGFQRIQAFLDEDDLQDTRTISPDLSAESRPRNDATIKFRHATICYDPDHTPVLKEVDLAIPKGKVVVCIGATGSGKTALVKAILGDMSLRSGSVEMTDTALAICTQTPWLPNGTVRQAIIGLSGQKLDPVWYDTVLRACCLVSDLDILQDGDSAQIGHGGIKLSGGQRQRVALARALYSHRHTIVLDDALCSLDGRTEDQVLHNLLGPKGLLRLNGVTCLLTTNTARHLTYADHAFSVEDATVRPLDPGHLMPDRGITASLQSAGGSISAMRAPSYPADPRIATRITAVAEAARDINRQTGDYGLYRHYFSAVTMSTCALLVACTASYSLFVTVPQYWLKRWTGDPTGSTTYYAGVYFLLAFIAWSSTNGTMWTTQLQVAPKSGLAFHASLLKTTLGAKSSFFFETDSATTINRFGPDMQLIDKDLPNALGALCTQIFKMAMQVGLLLYVQAKLIFLLPLIAAVMYVTQKIYLSKSRELRLLDLEKRAGVYASLIETTEGLDTIRAFGWEEDCARIHNTRLDDSQQPYYFMMCLQRWLAVVMDLCTSGIAVAVIGVLVAFKHSISGAQVGLAFNIILVMNTTLLRLIESWTNLGVTLGSVYRLRRFDLTTPQEDDMLETVVPPLPWPSEGRVEIRDLSVAYSSDAIAIEHCELSINAGQKVVIRGRTGSGKSTFLLGLLKMLDIPGGSITVDGIDTVLVSRRVLRERCFITLPQDPVHLPNQSLRNHLDPDQVYSQEQIIDVLEFARLWSYLTSGEFAEKDVAHTAASTATPTILDSALNALPALSPGRLQLLSLARAALRTQRPAHLPYAGGDWPKAVLLLDEVTSSLDTETEQVALEMIDRYFTGRGHTVVVVTHKVDAMIKTLRRGVDCVVTMGDGRIRSVETAP